MSSFVFLAFVVHHHAECDPASVSQSVDYFSYFDWMMTFVVVVAWLAFCWYLYDDSDDDCSHATSILDDSSPRSKLNSTIAFPYRSIYEWTPLRHPQHYSRPSPKFDSIEHRCTSKRGRTKHWAAEKKKLAMIQQQTCQPRDDITCSKVSRNCCASCNCFSNNCSCTFRSMLDGKVYSISTCFRLDDSITCRIECPVR